jgi:hypothetical protein
MIDVDLSNPALFVALKLEDRNKLADALIKSYSTKHAVMDVGVGLAGLIPVPGAAPLALVAAIVLQAPIIYQPLARELATIYLAPPSAVLGAVMNPVTQGTLETAVADVAGDLATQYTAEYGAEFIQTMVLEMLPEFGVGMAVSMVPILGAVIGATLDWKIANAMTKRVGYMTAIYFQNNAAWLGSKNQTYGIAKRIADIDAVRDIPEVRDRLVRNLKEIIKVMGVEGDEARKALEKQKVPKDLIDRVLESSK